MKTRKTEVVENRSHSKEEAGRVVSILRILAPESRRRQSTGPSIALRNGRAPLLTTLSSALAKTTSFNEMLPIYRVGPAPADEGHWPASSLRASGPRETGSL